MALIYDCDICKEVTVPECGTTLTIKAGLTPGNTYTWALSDKFGATRKQTITVNSDGAFTIDYSLFPEGYFNRYAGTFLLTVQDGADDCSNVDLTFCEAAYQCLYITYADVKNYAVVDDAPQFIIDTDFIVE